MRREVRTPRPDLKQKVEHLGLIFHTVDDQPYWNESAAYRLEPQEIEALESATNELQRLCLEAVEHVIVNREFAQLQIPTVAHDAIVRAWDDDPPAIYGRFDLSYDGKNPPKLLEYNADTPTSLLEAAVIQWHWLQEVEPSADQFNSIWEALVEKWRALKEEGYFKSVHVDFACQDAAEDVMTTAVMMDTAHEAGLDVAMFNVNQIGWDELDCRFVDPQHRPIQTIFKLYPWEWMLADKFGAHAIQRYGEVQWIEPIWKMVLSNKGILPILWEMFPGHPNLLPAFFEGPHGMKEYVKKPFCGREGANISLIRSGATIENPGPYDQGGFVYQELAPLPEFDGNHAVIGSWVIDCEARGIGIRESNGPITEDLARFVPHYF